MINIYWIKRDFRLQDNKALEMALANGPCMPLFILSPSFLDAPETSSFHLSAINQAIDDLINHFKKLHGEIAFAYGEPLDVFMRLHALESISNIYAHEEIGTHRTYEIDKSVHKWCKAKGIDFIEKPQTGVFRGLKDRDVRHQLWQQFYKAELAPTPNDLSACRISEAFREVLISSEKLGDKLGVSSTSDLPIQEVSETAAWETLHSFLYDRGIGYSGGISSPVTALHHGSRMSVHLAWGTITGPSIYQRLYERINELRDQKQEGDQLAGKWLKSLRAFSSRLHWRDHFIQRLESEPEMEFHALNRAYDQLEYDNNPVFLEAWKSGNTGYPMVDACIRCLNMTGFINFRMRAMLTSFACHSLGLDWKLIDKPMARIYTDYEPGIHLSQLQMQAGVVGINTIRMYSADKQLVDQDPNLVFVRQWIPEVNGFSDDEILSHDDKPLGDYPGKIVDWKEQSAIMRKRLYAIRRTEGYREIAAQVYEKHGSRKAGGKKR